MESDTAKRPQSQSTRQAVTAIRGVREHLAKTAREKHQIYTAEIKKQSVSI